MKYLKFIKVPYMDMDFIPYSKPIPKKSDLTEETK